MKNYIFAAAAFILLASYGCLKKAVPVPDKTNTQTFTFTPSKNPVITPVTGSWQWVSSYWGEGGLKTPANTHSTMRMEFETDSTVAEFRNDTLGLHENYAYLKSYTFFDGSVSAAVEMNQVYYRPTISHDTLRLDLLVMADPSFAIFVKTK